MDIREKLFSAVAKGQYSEVDYFLNNGVSVNSKNDHGWHILHVAIMCGHLDIVKLLVERGAYIGPDKAWRTPLHWPGGKNEVEIAKFLLEKGVNIHEADEKGMTALHFAASYNAPKLVQFLILKNSNINAKDVDGWTPLHWAARFGEDSIRPLVEFGANMHEKTKDGYSAIDIAIGSDKIEVGKWMKSYSDWINMKTLFSPDLIYSVNRAVKLFYRHQAVA